MSTPIRHIQCPCPGSFSDEIMRFTDRGYRAVEHTDIQRLGQRQFLVKALSHSPEVIVIYYRD